MKNYYCLIICFVFVCGLVTAQEDTFTCGDKLTDPRDKQVYATVKIGDQCWMAENLNIGKQITGFNQKNNDVIEKVCYDNDEKNCSVYGGLYTWHEMMGWQEQEGSQGICPDGWHVPTLDEWRSLHEFLGEKESGQKMKVTKAHDPAWDGNNESGFSALPGGSGYDDFFGRKGSWAMFWASTPVDKHYAWFTQLDGYWYPAPPKYTNLYIGNYYLKDNGFSVRCIKN
jgi:uncharacterized protein (TIGR02145 family)